MYSRPVSSERMGSISSSVCWSWSQGRSSGAAAGSYTSAELAMACHIAGAFAANILQLGPRLRCAHLHPLLHGAPPTLVCPPADPAATCECVGHCRTAGSCDTQLGGASSCLLALRLQQEDTMALQSFPSEFRACMCRRLAISTVLPCEARHLKDCGGSSTCYTAVSASS